MVTVHVRVMVCTVSDYGRGNRDRENEGRALKSARSHSVGINRAEATAELGSRSAADSTPDHFTKSLDGRWHFIESEGNFERQKASRGKLRCLGTRGSEDV